MMLVDSKTVIDEVLREAIRAYVLRNIHICRLCVAIIERQKSGTPAWVLDEMQAAVERIATARKWEVTI